MVPTDRKRRCTRRAADDRLRAFYDPENELTGSMLMTCNPVTKIVVFAVCRLRVSRQSDRLYSDEYHW